MWQHSVPKSAILQGYGQCSTRATYHFFLIECSLRYCLREGIDTTIHNIEIIYNTATHLSETLQDHCQQNQTCRKISKGAGSLIATLQGDMLFTSTGTIPKYHNTNSALKTEFNTINYYSTACMVSTFPANEGNHELMNYSYIK